jgi:alcohol dehydrogenase class IV
LTKNYFVVESIFDMGDIDREQVLSRGLAYVDASYLHSDPAKAAGAARAAGLQSQLLRSAVTADVADALNRVREELAEANRLKRLELGVEPIELTIESALVTDVPPGAPIPSMQDTQP